MHILGIIYTERFLSQYQKIEGGEINTSLTFLLFVPHVVEERNYFIQGIALKQLFKIPVRASKYIVSFGYDRQSSTHCKTVVHITKTMKRLNFYYMY